MPDSFSRLKVPNQSAEEGTVFWEFRRGIHQAWEWLFLVIHDTLACRSNPSVAFHHAVTFCPVYLYVSSHDLIINPPLFSSTISF